MNSPTIALKAAAALALAAAVSAPVLADTAVFRFDDLDLSTAAGKARFEARIETAVRLACPPSEATGTRIPDNQSRNECMRQARKQIVDRLATQGIAAKLDG